VGGVLIGVLMLAINWYYKHKTYQLLHPCQQYSDAVRDEGADPFKRHISVP
jgi:hypothetical protein